MLNERKPIKNKVKENVEMCIIVIKPKGVEFPSDGILEYCFRRNPHGAGIMLADQGKLMIHKGLMTEDEFFDVYRDLKERFPASPFILHFRWSTGGGIQPGLCHPFPIDNRKRVLMAKQPSNVKIAVAHNGIILDWSALNDTVSDTLLYVKNVLHPEFQADPRFLFDPANRKKIADEVNGSRLAFMTASGAMCTIGGFYKYDSVYYSKALPQNIR